MVTAQELREKYRRMLELRRTLEGPPDADMRGRLKALARDYPGALRELDTLPTDEIERRLAARADEPWVRWMCRFHELMKAALAIRAGREAAVDDEFVQAVKSPAHGRLMVVVFDRIAKEEGRARGDLWDALFPPRKGPRPYRRS